MGKSKDLVFYTIIFILAMIFTIVIIIPIFITDINKCEEFYINPKFNTIDEMMKTDIFKIKEITEYKSNSGNYCLKEYRCESPTKYFSEVVITFCNNELIYIKGYTPNNKVLYYHNIIKK